MTEVNPPEIPKEIEEATVNAIADKVSAPMVPGFVKRAYIRTAIERTWSNLFQGRSGIVLLTIWKFLEGKKTWIGFALYVLNHTATLTGHWTPLALLDNVAQGFAGAGLIHKADRLIEAVNGMKTDMNPAESSRA